MEDREKTYTERWIERIKKLMEENSFRLSDFEYGDMVVFKFRDEFLKGRIEIIDRTGGGCCDGLCPSFDIMVGEGNNRTLYKHVPIVDVRKKDEYNGSFVRNKCDEEMLEKRKTFPKLKDILE